MAFQKGMTAYIVENRCQVAPVVIVRSEGYGFYTAHFTGRRHGAVRLRASRFFATEAEARRHVLHDTRVISGSQYQYDNSRSPYGI